MSAEATGSDRRERPRDGASHAAALGRREPQSVRRSPHAAASVRAARAQPCAACSSRCCATNCALWAEPLSVQRFADYRAERPEGLTGWMPLAMSPGNGQTLLVIDGKFSLELLDLFFGGNGAAPHDMPTEFSPAAEAMFHRLGTMIAAPMASAWEPLAKLTFIPGRVEGDAAMVAGIDGDDPVVLTRFGIAKGAHKPVFIDIVYPVQALKPYAPSLTGKVMGAAPDPAWQNGLAKAMMTVTFPVRSVLAEPVISLAKLMELKEGDVIPITVAADVPVMVAKGRLGTGTVGTSNGRAAIRLNHLTLNAEELA